MEHYLALLFLLILYGVTYLMIQKGRRGEKLKLRKLGVFDAIKEALGRATEMGRPVFFTTGHSGGGLTSKGAGAHMAGLTMLGYVAEECARLDIPLIFVPAFAEMIPIGENIIREAAMVAGKPDYYKPEMMRYMSENPIVYNVGCITIMRQERPAANIMIGSFYSSDALIIAGAGAMTGAMQIAGGTGIGDLSNFISTCDYIMMGEETTAAGAYASGDIPLLNSVVSGDYLKGILMAMIVIGSLLVSAGIDLSWIFK